MLKTRVSTGREVREPYVHGHLCRGERGCTGADHRAEDEPAGIKPLSALRSRADGARVGSVPLESSMSY